MNILYIYIWHCTISQLLYFIGKFIWYSKISHMILSCVIHQCHHIFTSLIKPFHSIFIGRVTPWNSFVKIVGAHYTHTHAATLTHIHARTHARTHYTDTHEPCVAKPPGAGQVTHPGLKKCGHSPKFHNDFTLLSNGRACSWACFPKHLLDDVTAQWVASPADTKPPEPHLTAGKLEQCEYKVSCSRKQQHQAPGTKPTTFDKQANALTTYSC